MAARDPAMAARRLSMAARGLAMAARNLAMAARRLSMAARDLAMAARRLSMAARDLAMAEGRLSMAARDPAMAAHRLSMERFRRARTLPRFSAANPAILSSPSGKGTPHAILWEMDVHHGHGDAEGSYWSSAGVCRWRRGRCFDELVAKAKLSRIAG